jgi:cobaltochelatase CobS
MADIEKLVSDINKEIANEKATLVKREIEQQLSKFTFTEKNLSPTLMSIIMASAKTQTQAIPVPKRKDIPVPSRDACLEKPPIVDANVSAIVDDILAGNNVYLYGRAGTGKTYLAEMIARSILRRKVYIINCSQWTSPINIIGGQTIEGYKQGILIDAWENGGILILDELAKLDPNTAGLLNEALAKTADIQRDCDGEILYPTITDGKGDRIKKHKEFGVIATGNTNLKTISTNFSGNNRQDYSLVDRFSGSMYEIDYNVTLEQTLIYPYVFKISIKLREFLDKDPNSVESISLRTMLNFSRIFEQEMLRKIDSPLSNEVIETATGTKTEGKTLRMAVESFIKTLPEEKQTRLASETDINMELQADASIDEFIDFFKRLHNDIDPLTGEPAKA